MESFKKARGINLELFDMHVHGGGGYTFASEDVHQILKAYDTQASCGTKWLLATYVCLPYERMRRCLSALRDAMVCREGILGAYLEGPFINPEKAGGMRKDYIVSWNFADFKKIVEEFADIIKMVVVAPEMDGDFEVHRLLTSNGVKVAIGHTNSTYEECMRYVERGVFAFTHLYNAMRSFHHRDPGPVAAALLSESYCEIIPHPSHVHPAAIFLALRIKGDKIIWISDGTPLSASNRDSMVFGGKKVIKREGGCYTEEGKLYGSAITLREGFLFLEMHLGLKTRFLVEENKSIMKKFLSLP